MAVGFTTTCETVSITTKCMSSNPVHGEVYSTQPYVIKCGTTCMYLALLNLKMWKKLPRAWKHCKYGVHLATFFTSDTFLRHYNTTCEYIKGASFFLCSCTLWILQLSNCIANKGKITNFITNHDHCVDGAFNVDLNIFYCQIYTIGLNTSFTTYMKFSPVSYKRRSDREHDG